MEFDNATNLDRKSGVRGTKKRAEPHHLLLRSFDPQRPAGNQ
jgi:hypothetical protein